MKHFLPMLFLLFSGNIFSIGVLSGTYVKASDGMTPVECLHIGDEIVGCDFNYMSKVTAKITNIATKNETEFCVIKIDSNILIVPQDQCFFDPNVQCWIKAKNLTEENFLIDADFVSHKCLDIQLVVLESQIIYELSVTLPHTFFISEKEILVHNAVPILVALSSGAAASSISTAVISNIIAVSSAICLFCQALFFRRNNNKRGIALPRTEFSDDISYNLDDTNIETNIVFNDTNQLEVDGAIFIKPESMSWEKVLKNFDISPHVQNIVHKKSKHKKNKKHKNKKKSKCKKKKNNNSGGGDSDPDQDDKKSGAKKRIINTVSKTEFFHHPKIMKYYEFWKKVGKIEIYRLKDCGRKIILFGKQVFYIYWDYTHNDLEGFSEAEMHLGSIDPLSWVIYKLPDLTRRFPGS